MSQKNVYDVIIIGAGAAGLACAHELLQNNLNILVLEARSRIGGRAFTVRRSNCLEPIELGAEFIHGRPSSTLELLASHHLSFYDVKEERHFFQNAQLKKIPDFYDQIGKLMKRLSRSPQKDRSIEEFLQAQKNTPLKWKKLFRGFVEGFHGADLAILGECGLAAAEESDDDELNGSSLFRPTYGYDRLLEMMSHPLLKEHVIRFYQFVEDINWKKNCVNLSARSISGLPKEVFVGQKLVITSSIGVLKARPHQDSYINWNPRPKDLEFLEKSVEMGHVQKIVFNFRTRFWEDLVQDPFCFVHLGPEKYFPTWWNLLPLRSTQLIAWQGGPKAQEMAHWNKEERIAKALSTLGEWSGKSLSFLRDQMQFYDSHNWTEDPLSLGAYSYVKQYGSQAARVWHRPLENTIFFAGEATCSDASRGTLHGAFESGLRVAKQILKD